eukprot:5977915-Prymnesium_polylepis.1
MANESGKKPDAVQPTWGKGLVQQRSKEEQREYERREVEPACPRNTRAAATRLRNTRAAARATLVPLPHAPATLVPPRAPQHSCLHALRNNRAAAAQAYVQATI